MLILLPVYAEILLKAAPFVLELMYPSTIFKEFERLVVDPVAEFTTPLNDGTVIK